MNTALRCERRFRHILLPLFAACLFVSARCAACAETYFIDKTPLLLYKTINWWYSSLPEESPRLCAKPIACHNKGNALLAYDDVNKTLTITIMGGLADMLSIFKQCECCYGPSYLSCTWRHPGYFKHGDATVRVDTAGSIDSVVFTRVEREAARRVEAMQGELVFLVEGHVGGLSNGRIALHTAGNLLKTCGQGYGMQKDHASICLIILSANSKETLAKFDMVWEDCDAIRP